MDGSMRVLVDRLLRVREDERRERRRRREWRGGLPHVVNSQVMGELREEYRGRYRGGRSVLVVRVPV